MPQQGIGYRRGPAGLPDRWHTPASKWKGGRSRAQRGGPARAAFPLAELQPRRVHHRGVAARLGSQRPALLPTGQEYSLPQGARCQLWMCNVQEMMLLFQGMLLITRALSAKDTPLPTLAGVCPSLYRRSRDTQPSVQEGKLGQQKSGPFGSVKDAQTAQKASPGKAKSLAPCMLQRVSPKLLPANCSPRAFSWSCCSSGTQCSGVARRSCEMYGHHREPSGMLIERKRLYRHWRM